MDKRDHRSVWAPANFGELRNLDWRRLVVQGESRTALFAEDFPARLGAALEHAPAVLESFDQVAALELLSRFAGAWGSLGRDEEEPQHRYVYFSVDRTAVVVFQAMELRSNQVVVTDVRLIEPPP